MEENHIVHRRRKAAARKREKTPEPFSRQQFVEMSDDDEDDSRRARMEKMAEDTERMEGSPETTMPKRNEQSATTLIHEQQKLINEKETLDVARVTLNADKNAFESSSQEEEITDKNSRQENKTDVRVLSMIPPVSKNTDQRIPIPTNTMLLSDDHSTPSNTNRSTPAKNIIADEPPTRFRKKKKKKSSDSGDEEKSRSKSCDSRRGETSCDNWKIHSTTEIARKSLQEISSLNENAKFEDTIVDEAAREKLLSRSTEHVKETKLKQIIPLSNDSLMKDLERAQRKYQLTQERSILAPDNEYVVFEEAFDQCTLRKRKFTEETPVEKKQEPFAPRREGYLFTWLRLLRGKTKDDIKNEDKKDLPSKVNTESSLGTLRNIKAKFEVFMEENPKDLEIIRKLRNRCVAELIIIFIYCGLGAFVFRFTEGAFETFYKCGVKRVKRDFLDSLWNYSHNLREDDWKSLARKKLMEFEEQLHAAHEAGMRTYSGQRNWSFLNAVVYCLTVITTIGYGHISPITNTGRAITIVYAIFGIPIFLIILADFGKLFTRGMKFLWAFVRRVYYTGSCRKVRRTVPVQEVMKGVQLVYDLATFRRPSQLNPEEIEEIQRQQQQQQSQAQTILNLDGNIPGTPGTPAMSTFAVDDEFNLPISVAISILVGYIFIGAMLYCVMEGWGFFESFYFVFISMSTIGFGDYVPQNPISMMGSIVYMVFGLALTSMCINVVQVMLSDSFRQASQKIGATIGFEVAEDDGSVKPAAVSAVEIADVHTTIKESDNEEKIAPKAKQEEVDI